MNFCTPQRCSIEAERDAQVLEEALRLRHRMRLHEVYSGVLKQFRKQQETNLQNKTYWSKDESLGVYFVRIHARKKPQITVSVKHYSPLVPLFQMVCRRPSIIRGRALSSPGLAPP